MTTGVLFDDPRINLLDLRPSSIERLAGRLVDRSSIARLGSDLEAFLLDRITPLDEAECLERHYYLGTDLAEALRSSPAGDRGLGWVWRHVPLRSALAMKAGIRTTGLGVFLDAFEALPPPVPMLGTIEFGETADDDRVTADWADGGDRQFGGRSGGRIVA